MENSFTLRFPSNLVLRWDWMRSEVILVPLDCSCISVWCRDGAEEAGSRNADSVYNPAEVELASVLLSGEGQFQAVMQNATLFAIFGNNNRYGRKDLYVGGCNADLL